MIVEKKETYLINKATRDVNELLVNTPFVTAIIVPEKNEFNIEPYEVYQNYHGDEKKAKRLLAKQLKEEGFRLLPKSTPHWRDLGNA